MKPKYFVVKAQKGNLLWSKYISWLNETYNNSWGGDAYCSYYGYDGNIKNKGGTNCHMSISDFINNPTLLTLEEWEQLFILETPKIHEIW